MQNYVKKLYSFNIKLMITGKLHKAVEVALQAEGESGSEALRRVVESLAAAPHGSCDAALARKLVQPLLNASQPEQAASILASAQLVNYLY